VNFKTLEPASIPVAHLYERAFRLHQPGGKRAVPAHCFHVFHCLTAGAAAG
jgi:hypothetical protein